LIYPANQRSPFRVPGFHDKDSKRFMGVILRPDPWLQNTVYRKPGSDEYDIVVPTVYKGLYFKVKNPGLSGSTDPFIGNYIEGDLVVDGSCVWEAVNDNLMLQSETISSVIYSQTNSVTLTNTSNTQTRFQYRIEPLPQAAIDAGEFEVTGHVIKNTGEERDITLLFIVGEH